MSIVRIKACEKDSLPSFPEERVLKLLTAGGGMDVAEAEAAVQRLSKGKFTDVSFDTGEDKSAKDFARKMAGCGLIADCHGDERLTWFGSRPRRLFLGLSLAVLAGLGLCLWLYLEWPRAQITRFSGLLEFALIILWLWSRSGGPLDRRPRSNAQKNWDQTLDFRWAVGMFVVLILAATAITAPVVGLALLMIAVVGIGCAFLIRRMNRT